MAKTNAGRQSSQLATPQQARLEPVPLTHYRPAILFRLSRPRTWVFTTTSFLLGYTIQGWAPITSLMIGLAVACLITAATNIINAYADRHEDAINQPTRIFWIDRLGPKAAIGASALFYVLAIGLAGNLGALFLLVATIGIFNSLAYSLPPLRFKARLFPSLVSFSGAVGLPLLSGLAARGSFDLYNPILLLCTYFMFAYGAAKNLPDYEGDKKTGTRTTATIFKNQKSAVFFSGALLYTPYILLTAMVLVNIMSTTFLFELGFTPLLTIILVAMWKAKDTQQLEKAHTLAFFYAISFLLFTLVVSRPSVESIITLTIALLWSVLVSKVHIDSRIEGRAGRAIFRT